ncbi:flagellar basal-body MS-ring/collar protein FliF [Planomicrobium sp. CPCC 101079]|uniref:flagellar basal-body MS-ring/collar protein FliF n=1 Tax=Planomicrobium sp. CPCC 101079 TaxID=2599618 RepID=UPI0011B71E46|nr:flagellar basal-body MS-ring/collar protein FliF [Planomicrobium sp. CPCC 101079]TWT03691.1 flagellar M-ring protein FliF [Planomicrobium sp. CPCC 101079]
MKEKMASFKSKLTSSWSNFSPVVKWTIVGSFFATFLIILAFVFFSNKTEYGTLYSGLEASEAGEIKSAIEEQGIPVQVSADSTTISVPKEQISNLKVNLAAEGIPESGNVDYGIFSENMGLGMTDRHFDVVERDAMQNELASLIKQIDGVTEASVMITLPKENVWITDEEQVATASVVVKGDPSFQLDPKQVNGLYHLISKSVPNLPAEEIVIMDQNGQVFEAQEENQLDTSLSIYQQQREIKQDIEKDIQRELQQMLGLTLGQDKVVVSVMTSIDFTKEKREEKLVEPVNEETNEGIDISVERIVETYASEGATIEDTTGTGETEIANYPAAGEGGTTESEKTEERINREVNRINRQIEMSPYVIDDITINVGVEPPNPQNPASLTQQNIDDISNLLKNTVSTSLSMNGQEVTEEDLDNRISVFATEFQGKPEAIVEKEPVQVSWFETLIGNPLMLAIAGAVVLLFGGIVVLMMRRRKKKEEEYDFDIFDQPVVKVEQLEEDEFDLSEFDATENPKRKTIEKLAKGRPDDFAKLLRTWMAEE